MTDAKNHDEPQVIVPAERPSHDLYGSGARGQKPATDNPDHPNATTTKDVTDMGVPMRPLAPGQEAQQGPEDAADPNSNQRGDYSTRMGTAHHVVPIEDPETGAPQSKVVAQGPSDHPSDHGESES